MERAILSILEEFCDYLDDNHDLAMDGRRVVIDKKTFTLTSFRNSNIITEAVKKDTKFVDLIRREGEVFETLKELLTVRKNEETKVQINSGGLKNLDLEKLKEYVLCFNYETSQHILVNPTNRRVMHDKADVLLNRFPRKMQDAFKENAVTVKVVYDPFLKEELGYTDDNSLEVKMEQVTSYRPPFFIDEIDKHEAELPEIWDEFFNHLFPSDIDRDYVFDWVHYLLTSRNQTFLVLTGPQGTGKSTFAKLLMNLIGGSNFHSGKSDFATSRFNSFLDQKQLILLDEFTFKSGKEKDELKRIINDEITVEAKGFDQRMIMNRCSFMILNNYASAMSIDPWDRRFSVPSIATEDILKSKGRRYMKSLSKSMEDTESMVSLYRFFMERKPVHEIYTPFKSSYFHTVVRKGATKRYKYLIEYFTTTDKTEVSYEYLKEDYMEQCTGYDSRFGFPTVDEVTDFLLNYIHDGESLVSDVIETGHSASYVCKQEGSGIDD